MTTATTSIFDSIHKTLKSYQLSRVDFTFNNGSGIDFTVYPVTSNFDYNNDSNVGAIKHAIMTIVDDAFTEIDNITEVGGSIVNLSDTKLLFEGDVTTLNSITRTLIG
jgi:hypothetical protein